MTINCQPTTKTLSELDRRIATERGRLFEILPVDELRNIVKVVAELRAERDAIKDTRPRE